MGRTVALANASGTVTATYEYAVFGAVRASTGTLSSEYHFTGQQEDAATGLLYLRARHYDPATGRFLTKDPVRGAATRPQTQHPYSYAFNNPTHYTDPSGQCPVCVAAVLIWGGVEIGLTVWEAVTTYRTLTDSSASELDGDLARCSPDAPGCEPVVGEVRA